MSLSHNQEWSAAWSYPNVWYADGADHHEQAAERAASGKQGIFDVDEDSALAELKLAWADGGYHGFSVDDGIWSAISSAGQVLTGATADELDRKIRVHWQAMQ